MNLDISHIAIIVSIITLPATIVGVLSFAVANNLFVKPETLERELNNKANDLRKENIEHCQNCNKVKSLDNNFNRLEKKIDKLTELIIERMS